MRVLVPHRLALAVVLGSSAGLGCASIPTGAAAVDSIHFEGNASLSGSDIERKMATAASPRFLGLFPGVIYDYEILDRNVLQRDLARVARFYRARGFYETHVRAGRVRYRGDAHVDVTIEVEEGRVVRVHEIRVEGLAALPARDAEAARSAVRRLVRIGGPFEEQPFRQAEADLKRALTDRGYAWAMVERRADVDLPGHYANLVFEVDLGPRARFGTTRVEGLGELPEAPVLRAIDIEPGDPYSTETLARAQQAVLDLGVFGSVEVIPELEASRPDAVVPLLVRVTPQKLKSVTLGGGIQLDAIRAEIHLRGAWEHKNLFGGLRRFSVDARPGVDFYPTRVPSFQAPTVLVPEERLRVELRQPGFLEARTNGMIRAELDTYPVLLSSVVDPDAPVVGYVELTGSLAVDRTFWKLFLAPSYNLQWNDPFTYKGTLDPDLHGQVLSYVDLLAHFDLRDDALEPHRGIYLQNDLSFAGLGGDARDLRIQPEVRGYLPLGHGVTLAARTTVGFLLPLSYGSAAAAAAGNGGGGADRADWIRDIELIYLRGFFSGGPSSNRGYPLRGVGPHGVVPFFNPRLRAEALTRGCNDPSSPSYSVSRCSVPIGGLSLWEASLELRVPIQGPVGGALFCDASDVSPNRLDVRLDHPHLSCGIGFRYATPIGAVRVDVGYRVPGAQVPAGVSARLVDGDPGSIFGLPIAFSVGLGEAF